MDDRHPALDATDPEIGQLLRREEARQFHTLKLIPSENYASAAVLEAMGSMLTNKYSEGYARKRYYEGQQFIDPIEELAVARAKALFGADHANVQPYSGSPANLEAYTALIDPTAKAAEPDRVDILGLSLPHGGHLTHGWNVSVTSRFFNSAAYTVHPETHLLDYDAIRTQALALRPRVIVAGATAYPRIIRFDLFAEIAREAGALLLCDIAHIAGLVAGGAHPSPVPVADVVTTTTHKTLRGPRGGMILCKAEHHKAIDRAVFPGMQGGPHNHTTAAISVALREASTPAFQRYAERIVENSRALADVLLGEGLRLITGGSDNHLLLIDVTVLGSTGKIAAKAMDIAGLEANANTVPFDPRKPFDPSGVRIGTPALTSRGMGPAEMTQVGRWIARAIRASGDPAALAAIRAEVRALCAAFPPPGLTPPFPSARLLDEAHPA